ncbi:MAG: FAD-binding protein [Rhizobiaceae bacterium]|nr:FAD-binding protein [Rhizobiaceae bacterium]
MSNAPSWGRLDKKHRAIASFNPSNAVADKQFYLAYGNGRSYGDTCHNDQGTLLSTRHNSAIISFDRESGLLTAESGILLGDILQYLQGSGWFLPVVPGTKFVTLGGAIANDIHGKNHEKRGTFGCHVTSFNLWRSNGSHVQCSRQEEAKLFAATIGGMGLTGIVTQAQIQLMKVASHFVEEVKKPFASLSGYFDMEMEFSSASEYSVAWVDSLARGKSLGRGILMRGDHTAHEVQPDYGKPRLKVPLTPPISLVSGLPLRLFNTAYFHHNKRQNTNHPTHPDSFFFPLDAIAGWNRLYGPKGLFQHQCVVPLEAAKEVIPQLLAATHHAGQGSFLTVLKRFGSIASPGFMSFPRPGYTLTLDFANQGRTTRQLLHRLDAITLDAGGRTNPYKDARMSTDTFQSGFDQWRKLEGFRDPAIQSDFWRRASAPTETDAAAIAAATIAAVRSRIAPPPLATPVNQAAKGEVHTPHLQPKQDNGAAHPAAMGPK